MGGDERNEVTFQAYIDNSQAKTGKTPGDFKKLAKEGRLP